MGGVAQLVRASACHAEGHRFEPGRPRIENSTPVGVIFVLIKSII